MALFVNKYDSLKIICEKYFVLESLAKISEWLVKASICYYKILLRNALPGKFDQILQVILRDRK